MIFAVDVEAYQVDGELVIKEIALVNIATPNSDARYALLKMPSQPTSEKDQRTARYLYNYHHHIPLVTEWDLNEAPHVLDNSILLFHGCQKFHPLQELYPRCHLIPVLVNEKLETNAIICHCCPATYLYPSHGGKRCAMKKAYAIIHQLRTTTTT